MTPSEHNQQLLIDLANAHKENRELRDENRRLTTELIKKPDYFKFGFVFGCLVSIVCIFLHSCSK